MRRNQIIHEFDLLAEVLPLSLAGILLNVVGRQIAEFYGGLFVDMAGTAFTAFLLGPWWAAAVATTTTIVNGNFFQNYFPFGVVNIAGGLVWGYLARAAGLQTSLFGASRASVPHFIAWTAILTIVGGLACGLASTGVKLVLYPELDRPFIYGPLYTSTYAALQKSLGPGTPELLALAAVDLVRDLADKAVVVPAAMLLVALTRIAPTFGQPTTGTTWRERLRTDIPSIFVFSVAYSSFIFLAQLTRPVITIPGAAREVAWLGKPMMVVLLYAPLILGLVAFRFFTFRPTDATARRLHALCRYRRDATRLLFEAGGRWTSFVRSTATQALGTGVSIWPLRHLLDPAYGTPLALGVIVIVLSGYLVLARVFYSMLQRATEKLETLRGWLEVGSTAAASARLVRLMQEVLAAYIHVPEPEIVRRNHLVYGLGLVVPEQRGRLEELLFGRIEDPVGQRLAVVATIEEPRALSVPAFEDLASLVDDTGASLVALSTTTPSITDPHLVDWLRSFRKGGIELLLLDWTDLALAVGAHTLTTRPQAAMRRARARAIRALNREDEPLLTQQPDRLEWLAGRALPSLKVLIRRLPKASIVFDLGCGCGRHTIAAAAAGHDVVAIDKKEPVCERLRQDLAAGTSGKGKITIFHGDFLDVSAETTGLADLVICTGVLQHASDLNDLRRRLDHIAGLASQPAALVYIEMLFDMLFDGQPPGDGRMRVTVSEFEDQLGEKFPSSAWSLQRVYGPVRQLQTFDGGARSFEPPSRTIESTVAEYMIRRFR